jgi:hypothetical protein
MTTASGWTGDATPTDSLRREIVRRVTAVLAGAGIAADPAQCHLTAERGRLAVDFDLPTRVSPAVEQALAVRVLDAVRGEARTYGPVRVTVHTGH